MKEENLIIIIIVAVVIAGAILAYFLDLPGLGETKQISSFEECVRAGYPIMESYPEKCRTPDGKVFVRDISEPLDNGDDVIPPGGGDDNGQLACTMDAKLCPDGSYVGRVGPNCEFAPCPESGGKTSYEQGIQGIVLLGPMCPVMKDPPEEQCADKPYSAGLVVISAGSKNVVLAFQSDEMGMFRVQLPAGEYKISSVSGDNPPAGGLPYCSTGVIEVKAGTYTEVTVNCDTGIR